MSVQSNNQGRAYEYICLLTLNEEINKIRKSEIVENSAFVAAQNAWNCVDHTFKSILNESAKAVVSTIFDMEPMIIEECSDTLTLKIQTDNEGKDGDVRDILISRSDVCWEIGLSIKHNHFAVKHSRIGRNLDFGKKWFGVPCSENYWNNIKPVFDCLAEQIAQNKNWNELTTKNTDVYVPLLNAFMNEIKESTKENPNVPQKMVEYLLGEFDFYKVISIDSKRITQIQSYNLHGNLNKSTKTINPKIKIPIVMLPTRIVNFDFKPNSSNTVELYMDGGWQFNFRIHNASTKVEQSLKFDIQIIGMPTTIISINCSWK
ncbi:MAG: HaeIII family restriction endonuclease [Fibrobacteraceae bacterium]|nr:HaeIII family restriction endonuclease [Fibrobacteraceae bacterium]